MEISGSPTEKAILSWAYKVYQMFAYSLTYISYVCAYIYLKKAIVTVGDEV